MKRFFTLTLGLLFMTVAAFGQKAVFYSEDFSAGIPADYKIFDLDGQTVAPQIAGSFPNAWVNLGGVAGSTSWYAPPGRSDDWMITSAIELPEADSVSAGNKVLLTWFGQALDGNFPDGYQVFISTAGDSPADFTEAPVFQIGGESSAGANRSLDLSAYLGETIYIAFRNNSLDQFVLVIDNIRVAEYAPNSGKLISINTPVYQEEGDVTLNFTIENLGHASISSALVSYQVDDNDWVEETVTLASPLAPFASRAINHPVVVSFTDGKRDVVVKLDDVNEEENDNGATEIASSFSIYTDAAKSERHSLVETFTSSTCPPCLPGNVALRNAYQQLSEENRPILLKLQQDFPGTGDPYATTELIDRRGHYSVNAIPDTKIDGNFWGGNTNGITSTILGNAKNRSGIIVLNGEYELDTTTHSVSGSVTIETPVHTVAGTRLMLAVVEGRTVRNIKTNGETEFFDVVKKFLPNDGGIDLAGHAPGDEIPVEFSYTFSGNYRLPADGQAANRINHATEHSIEGFSNLYVVAWIEHANDRYVLNAAKLALKTGTGVAVKPELNAAVAISPNPAKSEVTVRLTLNEKQDNVQVRLMDITGKVVAELGRFSTLNAGEHNLQYNLNVQPGMYFLSLDSSLGQKTEKITIVR